MNKYGFIANSGIKKKKKRRNKKKIIRIKKNELSFKVLVPSYHYVSDRKNFLKEEIDRIIKKVKKEKRTPKNSVFFCNPGTIGFLRTYYGYPGSFSSHLLNLYDFQIIPNNNIENNVLISAYKDE